MPSLKASLKSSVKKTMSSLNTGQLLKNDSMTNVALVVMVALTVGYLVNKHYQATIFLYIVAAVCYVLCKNLFCALAVSIILTNLLLSMNYFKISENFKEGKDKEEDDEEASSGEASGGGASSDNTAELISDVLDVAKAK